MFANSEFAVVTDDNGDQVHLGIGTDSTFGNPRERNCRKTAKTRGFSGFGRKPTGSIYKSGPFRINCRASISGLAPRFSLKVPVSRV